MKVPKDFSLGWLPQLNPDPRMRIAADGEILYANPASIFLLQELRLDPDRPELLLPANYRQRLEAMLLMGGGTNTWDYRRGPHHLQCMIHYLPEHGYFHAYLTDRAEQGQ